MDTGTAALLVVDLLANRAKNYQAVSPTGIRYRLRLSEIPQNP
jgi:hypothetical protein